MSKQIRRRSQIIRILSDLSRNGWANARPADYQPLEAELAAINLAILRKAELRCFRQGK
jgi:hypothetical protein